MATSQELDEKPDNVVLGSPFLFVTEAKDARQRRADKITPDICVRGERLTLFPLREEAMSTTEELHLEF
jgi:hypothetical protein